MPNGARASTDNAGERLSRGETGKKKLENEYNA